MVLNRFRKDASRAQSAIEFLLLMAVVASIVLISFKTRLIRVHESSDIYFNRTSVGIAGKPNPCGDGVCYVPFEDYKKCPIDCPGP